jgi:hypothetical protein
MRTAAMKSRTSESGFSTDTTSRLPSRRRKLGVVNRPNVGAVKTKSKLTSSRGDLNPARSLPRENLLHVSPVSRRGFLGVAGAACRLHRLPGLSSLEAPSFSVDGLRIRQL